MNTKNFLSLAAVANLLYGLWYFLTPQGAANVYGFGAATTPLSNLMLQFMGILFFAEGVMCTVARKAEKSIGRTAVLTFVSVSSLLCFLMDIKTLMGDPGTMDYVDTVINGLFGFGALYFIVQDRRTALAG